MAPILMMISLLSNLGNLDALSWPADYSLECPSGCLCSKASPDLTFLKTDCSKKNYWLVPLGVSKDSTHVNFARNNIDYLPKGLLSDLMGLEVLDLSGNHISYITEGIFNGIPNISTLYLGENRISSLESGSFQGIPRLEHLWLPINNIWDLPRNILHGLVNLKVLSVSSHLISYPFFIYSFTCYLSVSLMLLYTYFV
ncbi:leucine-rich repeat-containing protein 4C-like isoform X2 [Stylophora pistillata]|uniref:leucine-rich repeat-containing protein 4C-like isoform X2 n=1 Tax=Stylophora pistillata TaxID=50429 RepID=UPI000C03EBD7|nr:leucine-rich repeat-containing protein 4C-like isoform X2 [Stylophora pistillata]